MNWQDLELGDSSLCGSRVNLLSGTNIIFSGGVGDESCKEDKKAYGDSFRSFNTDTNDFKVTYPSNDLQLYHHASCCTTRRSVLTFGGIHGQDNKIIEFFPNQNKTELHYTTGEPLNNRQGHTMSFMPKRNSFLLFGGITDDSSPCNELLEVKIDSFAVTSRPHRSVSPPALSFHSATFINGKIFVFGGLSKHGASKEMWSFDLRTNSWEQVKCKGQVPTERYRHGAAAIAKLIFVTGGINENRVLNDSFVFHTETKTWHKLSLNLPQGSGDVSAILSPKKLFVFSPFGSWAIHPRIIVDFVSHNSKEEITISTKKFTRMQQQTKNILEVVQAAAQSHPDIAAFYSIETLCNELFQTMNICTQESKPAVPKTTRSSKPPLEVKHVELNKQSEPKNTPLPRQFGVPSRTSSDPCSNLVPVPSRNNTKKITPEPKRGGGQNLSNSLSERKPIIPPKRKLQSMNSLPGRPKPRAQPPSLPRKSPESEKPNSSSWQKVSASSGKAELRRSLSVASNPRTMNPTMSEHPKPPQPPPSPVRTQSIETSPPKGNLAPPMKMIPQPEIPIRNETCEASVASSPILSNFSSKSLPKPPTASQTRATPLPRSTKGRPTRKSLTESNITESFYKSGSAWKRKASKRGISKWKFRYIKLRQNFLYYFHTDADSVPLGQLDMKTTTISHIPADDERIRDNHKWCVEFVSGETIYHFAFDSETELSEWLELLKRVQEKYYGSVADPSPGKPRKSKANFKTLLRAKTTINVEIGAPSRSSTVVSRQETQPSSNENDNAPGSPRQAILKEILTTERDYLLDLMIITDFYIKRLEDYNILKKDCKDVIFANVEELVPLHQSFLVALEQEFENPDPCVSRVFITEAPKWTPYSHFCSSQSNSKEEIERFCNANHNLAVCLEELRLQPECRRLDLASYLIKPMQRICKYPLLLRELKKETPADHTEYEMISEAIEIVSNVLSKVNENKRTADNLVQLLELQEKIPDYNLNLQKKGQTVIKQEEFKKVQLDGSKDANKHSLWLLNDSLLVAKKVSKGKYSMKVELPVESIIVWDLDPNGTSDTTKNAFSVCRTDAKNTKLVVFAKTAAQKIQWMELLNDCIAQTM